MLGAIPGNRQVTSVMAEGNGERGDFRHLEFVTASRYVANVERILQS